ncbi:MAG TPA: DUF4254 domain-containing protein [Burkholderiaceae bacterium]|nr:DUF4254 domain-containing protein [Burkholderiaceae bacterium]
MSASIRPCPPEAGLPRAAEIDEFQQTALGLPGWPETPHPDGPMRWVAANHRYNSLLWDEEDQARRTDVPDSEIAKNKRAIDRYNQLRNDAIESLDECLLAAVEHVPVRDDAWINSETAGSLIDRLSINALKIHHMGLQLQRTGVSQAHRVACAAKLERLKVQRRDLLECLERLLQGMQDGTCTYRIYRQFKMYNDPTLNPYLNGMKGEAAAANAAAA